MESKTPATLPWMKIYLIMRFFEKHVTTALNLVSPTAFLKWLEEKTTSDINDIVQFNATNKRQQNK